MYKNARIKIYQRTISSNLEGTPIEAWGALPVDDFRADVQPKNLTQAEKEIYGIDEHTANTMVLFARNRASLLPKSRALVTMDGGGGEKKYVVQPINYWPNHAEVLLIPVVGE
jgi:hypothetical protein